MRLRDRVRPPQRFESELFYQPTPQRSLRRPAPAQPAYIDFNPNLPPAAFPTLTTPRPPEKIQSQSQGNGQRDKDHEGDIQMDDAPGSSQGTLYHHADTETDDELEGIPMEDVDNYLASNGPQNTVYSRNMAIMAESDNESSASTVIDDMDGDVENSGQGAGSLDTQDLSDPGWCDLSPRLQVEIIENMLEEHPWSKIISLLGLTPEQDEQIRRHISNRNRQVEEENAQLEDMRAKQLEALMRIDNTVLRQNNPPPQIVFRKTSVRHRRNIKDGTESDYLLCKAGEVLLARRFLHKRGFDPLFAGRWGNEMVMLDNCLHNPGLERLQWRPDMESSLQAVTTAPLPIAQSAGSDSRPLSPGENGDAIRTQVNFINGFATESAVDPAELRIRKGDMLPPSKQPTAISQQPHPRQGILRLRIGAERAAKIRDLDILGDMDIGSPPGRSKTHRRRRRRREREQLSTINQDMNMSQSASSDSSEQPVLRVLGGLWSYNSLDENFDINITSSGEIRQRLEAARSEAHERMRETEAPEQNNRGSVSQLRRPQSSLPQVLEDLPTQGDPQRPLVPSVGEAFFESRPELVAQASAFSLKMPEKAKQVQLEEDIGGLTASSIPKHPSPFDNLTVANNPVQGPDYSPVTSPGQTISPKRDNQREQSAMVASVQKLECKDSESVEQKALSPERKGLTRGLPKEEVDERQTKMPKYDRGETPEIKESVANVPLHSESNPSSQPLDSFHRPKNGSSDDEHSGEETGPAASSSVQVPDQPRPPIRLIITHRGQQRQSMPNNCATEPEDTGNALESSRSSLNRPPEVTSKPKTKSSRRKSAPATSTKQKAPKKDTKKEPQRRSERLNGPPNQRVLRQRT
ncbi:hypothetical protein AOR_1_1024194 [Paecilomyces variotii No. 5]|uniref:Uncharacterized protein n=1 Tax=Byssochlamys spectabilis (strain No. 5 / NBRC 109023) TaxID=1356009 RepID=V5G3I2_BYSSN|nr:hypothetical protein AOR_1_1024194 [Paecilomyces variotii No. 5]